MAKSEYRIWAVFISLLAAVMFALSFGEQYAYVPASWVLSLTSGELAFLGVVALLIAIGVDIAGRHPKGA